MSQQMLDFNIKKNLAHIVFVVVVFVVDGGDGVAALSSSLLWCEYIWNIVDVFKINQIEIVKKISQSFIQSEKKDETEQTMWNWHTTEATFLLNT